MGAAWQSRDVASAGWRLPRRYAPRNDEIFEFIRGSLKTTLQQVATRHDGAGTDSTVQQVKNTLPVVA